jgi:hypothetical protein
MVRAKKYNFVVVLLSDEEMAQLAMATQYFRAMGRGPRSMSALMREAFKEWLENHKDVKEYIEANRPLLERAMKGQGAEGHE